MGSGGGGGGGRDLTGQELQLLELQFQQAQSEEQRRAGTFERAQNIAGVQDIFLQDLIPQTAQIGQGIIQQGQDIQRQGAGDLLRQSGAIGDLQGTIGAITGQNFPAQAADRSAALRSQIAQSLLGTTGPSTAGVAGRLSGLGPETHTNALVRALSGQNQPEQLQQLGFNVAQSGGLPPNAAGQQLAETAFGNVAAAARGETPGALQALFRPGTGPGGGVERDILERQFAGATRRAQETGQRGGQLSRTLGGLEAGRALGLAQIEQGRTEAQRQANLNLFGQAQQAGLALPGQAAAARLQAAQTGGQLIGQAGQLQQGGLLGAGQIRGQDLSRQLQGLTTAGELTAGRREQRLQELLGASGVSREAADTFLRTEALRQQGLVSAGGLQQDLAGLLGQQAQNFLFQGPQIQQAGLGSRLGILDLLSRPVATIASSGVGLTPAAASIRPPNIGIVPSGPSQGQRAVGGALTGAGTGFAVGGPVGALIGGVGGGLAGAFL